MGCAHTESTDHTQYFQAQDALVKDFLENTCKSKSPNEFARAWLVHETTNWESYSALYPGDEKKHRNRDADKLKFRQKEICKKVREAYGLAFPLLDSVSKRVTELVGSAPRSNVILGAAVTSRPFGVSGLFALNLASPRSFEKSEILSSTQKLLIYNSMESIDPKESKIGIIPYKLFKEARASYGDALLLGKLPALKSLVARIKGVSKKQAKKYSTELSENWEDDALSEELNRKYFSDDPPSPTKRYLDVVGLLTLENLAKNLPKKSDIFWVSPELFSKEAEKLMLDYAGGRK